MPAGSFGTLAASIVTARRIDKQFNLNMTVYEQRKTNDLRI